MRPHNSGHFSIEGSTTSQFEQHIRAVTGMQLGDASPTKSFSVMLNLLGQNDSNDYGREDREVDEASVHIYGKAPRAGRKMGHITALSNESLADAREKASKVWKGLQA
jgi:5-(carboxyamino)imidazole ribonucleotide synthase